MFLPFSNFILICIFNEPLKTLFRQIIFVCTVFVTNKNVKRSSGNCSTIDWRLISLELSIFVMGSILVSFNKFSKVTERSIASGSICRLSRWKNCMHVSSSAWFWASLIRLRERVFFIAFLQEISFRITENFTWVHTSESMIGLAINDCEEVFPSFCMFKSGGDQLMEFFIINFLKINVLVVIFLILLIFEFIKVNLVFVYLEDVLMLQSFLFLSLCL